LDHPLRRALAARGISQREAAGRLQVDPKTVERWCAGRLPYPRNRAALSGLTGWPEHDLWPNDVPIQSSPLGNEPIFADLRFSQIPSNEWCEFLDCAQRHIDILTESITLFTDHPAVLRVIRRKARSGVHIRILTGEPSTGVIRVSEPGGQPGIEVRKHYEIHYNSIYRVDDELLIKSNAYGVPASSLPTFHVTRSAEAGIANAYLGSFEQVWARAMLAEPLGNVRVESSQPDQSA
jgi:hypothetical protein